MTCKTSVDGTEWWSYRWDHRNRLVEVQQRADPAGSAGEFSYLQHRVLYRYDGLDRMIARRNDNDVWQRFVHDGRKRSAWG